MRRREKGTIGYDEDGYIILKNISSVLQRKNRVKRIRFEGKYKEIKKPVHF
jgi:hypothetical protein